MAHEEEVDLISEMVYMNPGIGISLDKASDDKDNRKDEAIAIEGSIVVSHDALGEA